MTDKISDATLLAGAALVIPSIAMIAPLGIAPLLAVLALALLAIEPRRRLILQPPLLPLAALLTALALWGALSASWSIVPAHSLFEAARFLLLVIAGLVVVAAALTVDDAGSAQVGRASLLGFALALAVVIIELVGDFPIRRALSSVARDAIGLNVLDRGATVLSLACCSLAAARDRGAACRRICPPRGDPAVAGADARYGDLAERGGALAAQIGGAPAGHLALCQRSNRRKTAARLGDGRGARHPRGENGYPRLP